METGLSALGRLNETERTEYRASLALRHTPHLGARSIRRLLGYFGSAHEAMQHIESWPETEVALRRAVGLRNDSWRSTARPEWDAAQKLPGSILLWTDPAYPSLLRELPDAPLLLYALGNVRLLKGPCLAVVGKRQCSPEGLRAATYFAGSLAEAGVTIVSGLAMGVDQAAHRAALGKPGGTIAVLGTGVDVPYPKGAEELYQAMCEQDLIVSEFAPGTLPVPSNFPIRNRIISGLSLGVLVAEAAPRSGSLITARLALEQNRTVYAVPGALGAQKSQGCQELIRQGAKSAFAASDIIEDIFPHLRDALAAMQPPSEPDHKATPRISRTPPPIKPAPAPLPHFPEHSPEAKLLAALEGKQALSIDTLDDALDLAAGELSALLTRLEIHGLIRKLPGQYYMLAEVAHA